MERNRLVAMGCSLEIPTAAMGELKPTSLRKTFRSSYKNLRGGTLCR